MICLVKGCQFPTKQIHVIVGKCLDNFDTEVEKNEVRKMRYKVKYTKDDKEDIMTYNEIIDYMSRDTNDTDGEYWKFRKIVGHQ